MSDIARSILRETYIESLSRFGVGFFSCTSFAPRGLAARESPHMRLRACVF